MIADDPKQWTSNPHRKAQPEMEAMMTLEEAFAYYTECNVATAELLEMRKSSSRDEIVRQRKIADEMVELCRSLGLKPITNRTREKARDWASKVQNAAATYFPPT